MKTGRLGARNVEVKARVADPAAVEDRARRLATEGPFELEQDDTFFRCATGRLKLRELAPDRGELIFYERPDAQGPKVSRYTIAPTTSPAALREALEQAWGVVGRVRKHRRVYLAGQTRIHLDRVEGLGDFVELEVVLEASQAAEVGDAVARRLLGELGIREADLVAGAYLDLLTPVR